VCTLKKYRTTKIKYGKTQETYYWEGKDINMQRSVDKIPQNVWEVCTVEKYKTGKVKSDKTQKIDYWERKHIKMRTVDKIPQNV